MKSSEKTTSEKYNPSEIEAKWQKVWEKEKIYSPNLDKASKPFYNLMMFPYPSAEGMHVGNMYAFTGADVYGRFQRMQGKDVFEPIGLDGFGIHSENYAIKAGKHPAQQAKISEKNYYKQLHAIGNAFDWTRTVETYKPEYYKWTQWLFIQLFNAGLAYRKKAPVNFCPSCKTVLADEQVIKKLKIKNEKLKITEEINVCERCETEIEKRELEQWFFKITKYADRLLSNIDKLDWSEKVKIAQRLWIGKSEGALIKFNLVGIPAQEDSKHFVEVFTTRADTLFGATFIVISPELAKKWLDVGWKASEKVIEYVKSSLKLADNDRNKKDREKTGVDTGLSAINPANEEKIPVWVADFVIGSYGTGAVFADAHDKRDFEFAKKFGIPLKPTLKTGDKDKDKKIQSLEECFTGDGILVNSGDFTGLTSAQARKKIIAWLIQKGHAKSVANYHLRDWLISRQRYWGPPIPLVFCENCAVKIKNQKSKIKNGEYSQGEIENPGWIAIHEDQLPVELPFIEDYKPLGTGQAPLASHPEFYKTKCPKCHGDAKRETDVSDTFLDSSWYFLRYVATEFDTVAFDKERVKKWLPVNMYIGGAEHSVLHLLYSRFITMVLKDLKFINFEEPFAKFRAHGLIVKDGAKMSKSKGNVVIPDEYVKKFGADALRTYLMFMGPFSQGGDFRDTGIEGMSRFLRRVWTLFTAGPAAGVSKMQMMHKTIKKVTNDISNLSYNTAIAGLMEWYNFLSNQKSVSQEETETFVKLISPFAPHISEELYQLLSKKSSIHISSWPTFDPKFLVKDEFVVVVQVNGKLRGNLVVDLATSKNKAKIEELARKDSKVATHLGNKKVIKVIYIEGKVVNFVVS